MQNSASEVLKERFFHSFVSPTKRKHPGIKWLKTVKQMTHEALLITLAIALSFIASFTWLLLAYQKNLQELQSARHFAIEAFVENESQNLLAMKSVLNPESLSWHQIPFYFKLSSQKLNILLDKKIIENARLVCAPAMMRLVCEQMAWALNKREWNCLLETLQVYLMIEQKEAFHARTVAKWFLDRRELLNSTLKISEAEFHAILNSINAPMFERIAGSEELCNKVILSLQSPELAGEIYEFISRKIEVKPITAASFISKHSANLFADNLTAAAFPYLFTKEGYRSFERMQKRLINAVASMPYLATVAEVPQINASIEAALSIYKENYELSWRELLSKLRFKKPVNFESLLENTKRIASELDAAFSLIERLEKNLIIEDDLQLLGQAVAKIAPEKLSAHLPQSERMINHIPLTKENIEEYKQGIKKELDELVKQMAAVSSSPDLNKACYNLIASLPEDEAFLQKSEAFAKSLPTPIGEIYLDLVDHIKCVVLNHAALHINQAWRHEVADYYAKHIAGRYPFNKANYRRQVDLAHFSGLFGANGRWSKFKSKYLDQLKEGLVLLNEGKKITSHFNAIQAGWFGDGSQLKVAFSLTNATITGEARAVNLYLLGESVTFSRSYFGPHSFEWQKEVPELAKVEFLRKRRANSSLTYTGAWAWYKLLSLDGVSHEKVQRKLSSPAGEIRFSLHLHEGFRPLSSNANVPTEIVAAISQEIYE
jgi:type VI protein secretion system component VasK